MLLGHFKSCVFILGLHKDIWRHAVVAELCGILETYLSVIDICIYCGQFHTCGKYLLMISGKMVKSSCCARKQERE